MPISYTNSLQCCAIISSFRLERFCVRCRLGAQINKLFHSSPPSWVLQFLQARTIFQSAIFSISEQETAVFKGRLGFPLLAVAMDAFVSSTISSADHLKFIAVVIFQWRTDSAIWAILLCFDHAMRLPYYFRVLPIQAVDPLCRRAEDAPFHGPADQRRSAWLSNTVRVKHERN